MKTQEKTETFHLGYDKPADFEQLIKNRKEGIERMTKREDGKKAKWSSAKPGEHRTIL